MVNTVNMANMAIFVQIQFDFGYIYHIYRIHDIPVDHINR